MTEIKEIIKNSRFVVLIGKNGAGKSTLLRSLIGADQPNVKYIYPERGGVLRYELSVEATTDNENVLWTGNEGNINSFPKFKEQSAVEFRRLELLILREIESLPEKRKDLDYTFDRVLDSINNLLFSIKIIRSGDTFSAATKADAASIPINSLSSGESEMIALAIEVLKFSRSTVQNKVLLLDEPDVHLHPDLQYKFIEFVENVANKQDFKVVISTHSTAIIAGFSHNADLKIVPVTKRDQKQFLTFTRSAVCEEILPIFGAHPLSSAFNKSPIVLVEGDDDKRVLEQVVRSSQGRVKLSPCVVGTVDEMQKWEDWLNDMLPAIYDQPKAFSLRDLDAAKEAEIKDTDFVCRTRLNCYAMENLLLCDQSLAKKSFDAESFKEALKKWVKNFSTHQYITDVQELIDNYDNRRTLKIKNIRNIIIAVLETSKPWEVFLGQLIASHRLEQDTSAHSLQTYLGEKVVSNLLVDSVA